MDELTRQALVERVANIIADYDERQLDEISIDDLNGEELDCIMECLQHGQCINTTWIPCSEKLPDDIVKDCLVTLENGAIFQASYSSIGQEFRMICWHGIERFSADNKVVAWQPLPQPYNPTEN